MKTVICYYSSHHGNTRKVVEAMAEEGGAALVDLSTQPEAALEEYGMRNAVLKASEAVYKKCTRI